MHLKRHALCLLRTLLVASEEHATEHVLRLVPVLARLVHALLQREAEQDDRFHSGINASAHVVTGGGGSGGATSASAASSLASQIGKPSSAVISAHTIDQDPFHQNEDLKTPVRWAILCHQTHIYCTCLDPKQLSYFLRHRRLSIVSLYWRAMCIPMC